jgi:hypothetical protein
LSRPRSSPDAQQKATTEQRDAVQAQRDLENAQKELTEAQARVQKEGQEAQQAQQQAQQQTQQAQQTAQQSQQTALEAQRQQQAELAQRSQQQAQQQAQQSQQQAQQAQQQAQQSQQQAQATPPVDPTAAPTTQAQGEQLIVGQVLTASDRELLVSNRGEPQVRLQVQPGTVITVDGRMARAAEIREGSQVRASYNTQAGEPTATRIDVTTAQQPAAPAAPNSGESTPGAQPQQAPIPQD